MGWGDSVGTSGSGGGYGGGHDSTDNDSSSGRSSGRGGGGYSGAIGDGVDASSRSRGGFGGTDSHTNFSGSSVSVGHADYGAVQNNRAESASRTRADTVAQTRTEARRGGLYNEVDTGSPMGSVTNGAVADMSDIAERSFMDRLDATPVSHEEAGRGIQEKASPGWAGKALSTVVGVFGGPLAGAGAMGINTSLSAREAARNIDRYNGITGANLDASVGHSMAQQSVGTATGFVGGKAVGTAGANIGASVAGLPGAIAGGLIGGVMGQNAGRSAAFSDAPAPPGVGSGSAQDTGGQLASATSPPGSITGQTARANHGPVDFDGYASYAESFFA